MRTCVLLAAFAGLCSSCLVAQEADSVALPRIGQPQIRPELPPLERTYGFLVAPPQTRFLADGVIELRFETLEPTPGALVYGGLNTLDEDLDFPRYRVKFKESGEVTVLRREHVVALRFASLVRKAVGMEFEPRLTWRIEVWLPSKRSSRFYEGRVYFDPETLGEVVNVVSGPFVDQVGETSAIISWQLDRPAAGQVKIGERVFASAEAQRHELKVEGLRAGTRYHYQVSSGSTVVRPYAFRTAGGDRFRFAVLGDSREGVGGGPINMGGVAGQALFRLGTLAYRQDCDFMLITGDLINGYTTGTADFRMQLDAFQRALAPLHARLPIYEAMGNHEALVDTYDDDSPYGVSLDKRGDESAEAVFAEMFVNPLNGPADEGEGTPTYLENVYWFDRGNTRFFVLNNNYWWSSDPHQYGGNLEGYILPAQLAWLRAEVARADGDAAIAHLFFCAQEPPFPCGGHAEDAMWYHGGDTNSDDKVDAADIPIVENRNELWEILASSAKTVAFLTGDEHAYHRLRIAPDTPVGSRMKPDGSEAVFAHEVWQVCCGAAGAPWYGRDFSVPWTEQVHSYSTQPHVALLTVDGPRVTLETYSQTGQLIDSAALR